MNQRKQLMSIAERCIASEPLKPEELTQLLRFTQEKKTSQRMQFVKQTAIPLSLIIGVLFVMFPEYFVERTRHFPQWTNLPIPLMHGADYLWDVLGEPVGKQNIIYHVPNLILYSFGILGIKKIIDALNRKTWLQRVLDAQELLREQIKQGKLFLSLKKGHSLLFIGKGDFIGMQFVLNHKPNETVSIAEEKPLYTDIWNYYSIETLYDDLKDVLIRSGGANAGEYVFLPVKDDQIFLPGEKAYDLSPHKLDIVCQNIRKIEQQLKWKTKRIIIIGDKFHKSFVVSEDRKRAIKGSEDTISLESIAEKYTQVTLLDPSDIVLKKILAIAKGRKIVFRATKEGIAEYKERFYSRLHEQGYSLRPKKPGVLTIGYDLFEDQTEQQTLSRKIDDYFPVVLSRNVHDALLRNGYQKDEFLYVPDLVLEELDRSASSQ